MLFIILLGVAAFSIATVSGFFSIVGLAQTFSGIFWSVIAMGVVLEYGKLIGVSFLYRYWNKTAFFLKAYLISASFVLMTVTSAGIFGYLSSGYLADTLGLKQVEAQMKLLADEENQLQQRKKQIDQQVSQLKTEDVRGRQRLSNTFKGESQQINERLPKITIEKQELQKQLIKTEAHTGPIVYIAKALGLPIDDATKYIIFILITVFDPLAVVLTICVNMAICLRKEEQQAKQLPKIEPIDSISSLEYFQNKPSTSPKIPDVIDRKPTDQLVESVSTDVIDTPQQPEAISLEQIPNDNILTVEDKDQIIEELRTKLSQLEQIPHPSDTDHKDIDLIKKYFERAKIVEKVRMGML